MSDRLIRKTEVKAMIGVTSNSTLYGWVLAGTFPAPVRLGERIVAWRLSEVQAWIDACPKIGKAELNPDVMT